MLCSFCERLPAAAKTKSGKVGCCARCAASELPALIAAALCDDGNRIKAIEFSLVSGLPTSVVTSPAPRKPAKKLPVEVQRAIVGRAAAKQAGQVSAPDIEAMVTRAGLRTASSTAAELSTVAAGTATGKATSKPAGTPVKRLPATRVPTRSEIAAKVRKAGFDA
jgi:hypothetical protein